MQKFARLLLVVLMFFGGMTAAVPQSTFEKLISPGALSNAHAKLESKCSSCHESFSKGAQNSKCLSCHKGIASDISRRGGFHGKFDNARTMACKTCHSDHKGRGFGLIHFNRATFNHNLTDYPLEGGHIKATCAACHGGGNNYRGTSTTCVSCHAKKEPHLGKLGRACQSCHTPALWKKIKPFDHSRTGFALRGKHSALGCMSCHAGQRWKGISQACISCHAKNDVHKGSRGTNCASCHTPVGWKSATFNHNTDTRFDLVGAHAKTACAGCHGAGNAIRKPPMTCYGCHSRDDSHKGNNGTDCAKCHNPRSWQQASFNHDTMTRFPLRGEHDRIVCEACHKQPPKVVKPPVTCIGCHAKDDFHKGNNGTDCGKCHNPSNWKVSSFDHNIMTKFPIKGAHMKLKCEQCHIQPATQVKLSVECNSCHAKDDVHKGKLGLNCIQCHSNVSWKEKVAFDHDLTRFPLLGKHALATCDKCHLDKGFTAKGTTCVSCHADEKHKGILGLSPNCANCHGVFDWKSWNFDHDIETAFPLTGKHQGLVCSACHIKPGDPSAVSSECISCHKRDDVHKGEFGNNCQKCHVTDDFSKIKF